MHGVLRRAATAQVAHIDFRYDPNSDTEGNFAAGYTPYDTEACPWNCHGTEMTAIIAAAQDGTHSVGVAPSTQIVPIWIPCDPVLADVVATINGAIDANVIDCTKACASFGISIHSPTVPTSLLGAIRRLVDGESLPVIAARDTEDAYPGVWDQGSSEPLRLSVQGVDQDGQIIGNASPDIFAPADNIHTTSCNDSWIVHQNNVSGSTAVAQVAGVAALARAQVGGCSPSAIYNRLLDTAYESDGVLVVNATGAVGGPTGIDDVANLVAIPLQQSVEFQWDLTDDDEIDGFSIQDGTSCWGPFEPRVEFIGVGDPQYTTDGIHYSAVLEAPYDREYFYRVVASYNSTSAFYEISVAPIGGLPVTPASPPSPQRHVIDPGLVRLRWAKTGGFPPVSEYWVYKEFTLNGMTSCGFDGRWGRHFRASVPHAGVSCGAESVDSACWYDADVFPWLPRSFRVASVKRDAQDRVQWASALSMQVSGYTVEPAEAEEHAEPGIPTLRIRAIPTPSSAAAAMVEVRIAKSEDLALRLFDLGKRVVAGPVVRAVRADTVETWRQGKDPANVDLGRPKFPADRHKANLHALVKRGGDS